MAYSLQDQVALINKTKATNPALAYAMYNGFSGMGGGPSSGGALDIALRDAWGPDAAKNWVNSGGGEAGASGGAASYGFDPTTGQYSSWGGDKGTVEGYNGANYDPNAGRAAMAANPTLSYDPTHAASNLPGPTGTGLNAAQGIVTHPDGTYTQAGTPTPEEATQIAGLRTGRGVVTGQAPLGVSGPAQGPYQRGNTGPKDALSTLAGVLSGSGTASGGGNGPGATPGNAGGGVSSFDPNGKLGSDGADGSTIPTANSSLYNPLQPGNYTAPTRNPSSATPFDLFNDPGYKFMLKEATDSAMNAAGASGQVGSGALIKAIQDRAAGLSSQEYDKAYGRFNTDRNFGEQQFQTDRNFGRSAYVDNRNFDQAATTDARDYNNNNRKSDMTFNNNNRIDARNFDQGAAIDARDYATGVARDNRNFDYTAQTGDRAFKSNTLAQLAQMGLGATGGNAQLQTALANLLSGNTMTGAGAGAAGTVGGANNINNMISQIMQYMQSNNLVNAITKP